jgi:hypothetical protein
MTSHVTILRSAQVLARSSPGQPRRPMTPLDGKHFPNTCRGRQRAVIADDSTGCEDKSWLTFSAFQDLSENSASSSSPGARPRRWTQALFTLTLDDLA